MPIQILALLIGLASTAFGSVLTLLISKRKNKAETLGIELDNANKVISIWRELSEEQICKVQVLEIKINELVKALRELEDKYEKQCDECSYKKFYNDKKSA